MPKVLSMVGYAPWQIGTVFAIAPLVRFIIPFVFLKHISLTPKVFNFSLLLGVIASAMFYLFLENFYLLMLTNALLGAGMSLSIPYVESIALSYLPKDSYGKVRLFGSVGFILVSLILVKFLNNTPYNAISFLVGSSFFTMIFGLFLLKFEQKKQPLSSPQGKKFNLLQHWPLWTSLFLMQVGFGAFYNFFTIYVSSYDIGIASLNISSLDMTVYLWSFGVICEIVMLYFQAPLLKNSLLKVIEFSIGITVLRWTILAIFPDNLILLFISQSIHAFSFALYHSATIIYLHHLYKDKKLSQQFFAGIAYGLGGFVGSFGSGFIYEYSSRGLYLAAALITFSSLMFLWMESGRSFMSK